MKTRIAVTLCLLALGLAAAKKDRDWKMGILEETAHAAGTAPAPHVLALGNSSNAAAAAIAASQPRTTVLQGLRIEGNGYRFLVSCDITRGKVPNVTVHGAIKYALEDGTFYFLDDDGREFKAVVLEKALLPTFAVPPAAAAPAPPANP
jgi:hypothetical protein